MDVLLNLLLTLFNSGVYIILCLSILLFMRGDLGVWLSVVFVFFVLGLVVLHCVMAGFIVYLMVVWGF